jgi:DNA primase
VSGRIPDNILEDILSRVDIVEVILGYIPLKRAGRNFRALCPFHHEKTPSFMVSPERQIYHCFGCHESGNAFKFLMSYERMEFPEAVEMLAKKAGVILPSSDKEDYKNTSLTAGLYKINELASVFFTYSLDTAFGENAKNYLRRRGIKDETIKLFQLGYASDRWDALLSHLRAKNISLSSIEKAGLILAKEAGGYYDRFRNRLIFPIIDIKNRVLGFGARVLDNTLPKYINSPESPIYTKGKNLYGLNFSKEGIRETGFVVIVEGYLDFIIPFQAGLKNIVASLGTALTLEQARLIKRYTHNVVMVYDADAAGELATLRTLDIFIEEGIDVKVVSLPKGFDPDLFVREKGIADFKEKIEKAQNLFDYKIGVLKSRYNYKNIEGKAKVAQGMLETVNKFKNAVLKSEYIKKLAQELDIREEALLQEIKKIKDPRSYPDTIIKELPEKKTLGMNPTEKLLIKLMLEEKELIDTIKHQLEPADFRDERASRIVSIMFDLIEQGKTIEANLLTNYFNQEDITQIVCESVFLPEISEHDRESVVNDCIRRLKNEKLKLRRQNLHEQIKTAQTTGDEEKLNKLMQEFHHLIRKG